MSTAPIRPTIALRLFTLCSFTACQQIWTANYRIMRIARCAGSEKRCLELDNREPRRSWSTDEGEANGIDSRWWPVASRRSSNRCDATRHRSAPSAHQERPHGEWPTASLFKGVPKQEAKVVKAFVASNAENALKTKPKVSFVTLLFVYVLAGG